MVDKKKHYLIIIILLGLLLRLSLSLMSTDIGNDTAMYLRLSKNLVDSGTYSFGENYNWGVIFSPGYPLFVALLYKLIGNLFLSGKIISLLFGVLAIPIFYLIGKELTNKNGGLWLALCYSIYPFIINVSSLTNSESTYFFFFGLAILNFIRLYKYDRWRNYIMYGVSVGLAILCRSEGIFLLLLMFMLIKKVIKKHKYLINITVSVLIIFIIVWPYMVFLHNEIGKYTVSGKSGLNLHQGIASVEHNYEEIMYSLNEDKTQLISFENNNERGLSYYLTERKGKFIKRYFVNIWKEIKVFSILIIPILFFIIYAFKNKEWLKFGYIFLIMALCIALALALFFISVRYLYTIIILFAIFSVYGFRNIKYRNLFVILFILLGVGYTMYMAITNVENPTQNYKDAGLYLKNIGKGYEDLNIMARKTYISYYSDSRHTSLPYASEYDVFRFAHKYEVDYIVVDDSIKNWPTYYNLSTMDRHSNIHKVYDKDNIKIFWIREIK